MTVPAWIAAGHLVDHTAGGILPAFVVGAEMDRREVRRPPPRSRLRTLTVAARLPFRGYLCHETTIHGAFLPLHANPAKGHAESRVALLDALTKRAQSHVDRKNHNWRSLSLPSSPLMTGNEMSARELEQWASALARSYVLPALLRGWEARLDFTTVTDPWLVGWNAVLFRHGDEGAAVPTQLKTLDEAGASALTKTKPRLFLVWENID